MYKTDYENKMEELLADRHTYKTIRTDPTEKLRKQNNTIINDLHKQNFIDLWKKLKLTCSAAAAPRLYGLPKIHKQGLPLRPISSSMNVPCYQLSKLVGEILKCIISDEYNINNAFQLKERLQKQHLEEDDILVSFDVISLFTNIPTYLAKKTIMNQWNTITKHTQIPKKQFTNILDFCLKDNNYFQYNNKLYNQTNGMPMGNPLSPTIADIILDNLFENTLTDLKKDNIEIKFITKYVDDVFAIIKNKDKDIILNTLNKYHEKLQFTVETEENSSIPFLDTKIHRKNNNIILNWYTKPTSSGRIINFHSTQPMKMKINTAKNLINKVFDISDPTFHKENKIKLKTILRMNNYPTTLIKNLIENKIHNNKSHKTKPPENELDGNPTNYCSITYVPSLTENRELYKTINRQKNCFRTQIT